jgi:cytochrome c-type biogenesis protein CcmE
MNGVQKRRLYFILFVLVVAATVGTLILYALKQNVNLFYTPTQLLDSKITKGQLFRLGGEVKKASIHHNANNLQVSFSVSDKLHHVLVEYEGVLPDLFREGQAVVVEGILDQAGIMQARQVLAKHDERYRPAHVSSSSARAV